MSRRSYYGAERIKQVIDVKTDLNIFAAVLNLELLFGLFLFGVMCLHDDSAIANDQSNAAVFFIGENGRALQRPLERGAISAEFVAGFFRDDAVILGKPAINKL